MFIWWLWILLEIPARLENETVIASQVRHYQQLASRREDELGVLRGEVSLAPCLFCMFCFFKNIPLNSFWANLLRYFYTFSNNISTVLHIHTISNLDFNKSVQFFANVDSKCCHRGLKCFSAQVMKIKEDLIAQEPKHREAMEEVWNDMMVGNISKCFAVHSVDLSLSA